MREVLTSPTWAGVEFGAGDGPLGGSAPGPGRPAARSADPAVAARQRAARPHPLPQAGHPGLHGPGGGAAAGAHRGDRRRACSPSCRPATEAGRAGRALLRPAAGHGDRRDPRRARRATATGCCAFGTAAAPSLDLGLSWRQFRDVERGLTRVRRLARRAPRRPTRAPRRRPAEPARRRARRRRRRPDRPRAQGHRRAGAGGRLRDHGQPARQRHRAAARAPRPARAGSASSPTLWPNAVDEVLRLDPPVLLTGRTVAATPDRRRPGAARVRWSPRCSPGPTATPRSSPTPTASTSPARTPATTCRSRPGGTTAWARRWPGWRARWACARLFERFPDLRAAAGGSAARDPHPARVGDAAGAAQLSRAVSVVRTSRCR